VLCHKLFERFAPWRPIHRKNGIGLGFLIMDVASARRKIYLMPCFGTLSTTAALHLLNARFRPEWIESWPSENHDVKSL
jgi:hypothetical protein